MSNIFFVFTPFQLYIAQQIIHQEKLKNNILLAGYIAGNSHFLEIYETMKIDGYWDKTIVFPNVPDWDFIPIRSYKDFKYIYNNYKQLKKILEVNHAEIIYLGEMQNPSLRFTNIVFAKQGYKVAYFEEGYAHYVRRPYKKDLSFITKLKIWFRDTFYYLPIFHVRYAKWLYQRFRPYEELPIYKRYSILPMYDKEYDVRLYPVPLFSKKVECILDSDIDNSSSCKKVLLLTEPLEDIISTKHMGLYFDTINESLSTLEKDTMVYIKFHPRDKRHNKEKTEQIIRDAGLQYKIISQQVNLPVEFYLQRFTFDKVYIFMSSTFAYCGYMYPKCNFEKLLPTLNEKCKKAGINKPAFEKMIKFMDNTLE